ncbi:hypothetical protein GCM10028791_26570 [Echinicola sediminis]
MINIVPYQQTRKKEWEALIQNASNSTFLHSRDFMDYHQDRFEDCSLMAYLNNKLVAVLPANLAKNQVHSHQGLTYGGILVDRSLSTSAVMCLTAEFLEFYNKRNLNTLFLKLAPSIYGLPGQEVFEYIMFVLGAVVFRTDLTYALTMPFDGSVLSKRRIRGIKKGEQNGVVVKKTDDYEPFWKEVLCPNLMDRHGVSPVHDKEEIAFLHKNNPGAIHQYEAFYQDQLVAGITVFETEKVAHTQYIASTTKGREVGALDVLVKKLVMEEFAHKAYLNFGIVNEKEGTCINKGLMEWKESFGAKPYAHKFYRIATGNFGKLYEVAGKSSF